MYTCVCIYKGIFSEVADFFRAVSDLINISLGEVNGISEAAGLETYFLALQMYLFVGYHSYISRRSYPSLGQEI